MTGRRSAHWTFTLAALAACCGPGCRFLAPRPENPLPRALPPGPTLEQVIDVVNRNSRQIQSFVAPRATLSGEGFPTLRADVAFERPRRLRLRAGMTLSGQELDVGSNDQLFWVWVKRNEPPALLYAYHEQFQNSPVRQTLPFEPEWLIDALGLAEFDSRLPHQGPYARAPGQIEVRTVRETPQGMQTKVTVVDAVRGCILQQSVYDSQGRLLATADSVQHRRDPLTGLIMPGVVSIRSVPAQLAMRLDLGAVEINRAGVDLSSYWAPPTYEGYPAVDLCHPPANQQAKAH